MKIFFHFIISFQIIILPIASTQASESNLVQNIIKNQSRFTAAGLTGMAIPIMCRPLMSHPSVIAFTATGTSYVALHVFDNLKTKQERNDIDLKNSENKNVQTETYKNAMREKRINLESVRRRLSRIHIASVGYSLATALAIIESINFLSSIKDVAINNPISCKNPDQGFLNNILGGEDARVLSFIFPSKAKLLLGLLKTPVGRSVALGGLSTLSFLATKEIKERRDLLNEEINDLESLIEGLENQTNEQGFDLSGDDIHSKTTSLAIEDDQSHQLQDSHFPEKSPLDVCFDQKNLSLNKKSCQSKLNFTSFNQKANITSPVLRKSFNDLMGYAEAVASGDQQSAKKYATSLLKDEKKIKDENQKLQNELNKKLKEQNQNKAVIEKSLQDDFDRFLKVNDQMNLNQVKTAPDSSMKVNVKETSVNESSSSDQNQKKVHEISITKPQNFENLDFDFTSQGDQDNVDDGHLGNSLKSDLLHQDHEDFSGADDGISKNENGKIFDQISQRYILNYSQIFERKKKD